MDRPALTIVVPLFDEAEGVAPLLAALRDFVAEEGRRRTVEVVLVDDGSTDGTAERLRAAIATGEPFEIVEHGANRGLTAALHTGTCAARSELVGWLDADLSYEPALLGRLATRVDAGADVAVASCHHPDGGAGGVPGWRLALSRGATRVHRLASGARLHTFTCMVRVMRRDLYLRTTPRTSGFLGVTEQLLRCIAAGATVVEEPATLHRRTTGRSKMRILRVAAGHLRLALRCATGGLRPSGTPGAGRAPAR